MDTIAGFSSIFPGGIITEIAGVERCDYKEAKVSKFAGIKWRKTQSADFQADETCLTCAVSGRPNGLFTKSISC